MEKKIDKSILLSLFKTDLAIKNTVRDDYFQTLIDGCSEELLEKGIRLDWMNISDVMLVVDYSVWQYRHRMENIPLPSNLKLRIRNRIIQRRGEEVV